MFTYAVKERVCYALHTKLCTVSEIRNWFDILMVYVCACYSQSVCVPYECVRTTDLLVTVTDFVMLLRWCHNKSIAIDGAEVINCICMYMCQ